MTQLNTATSAQVQFHEQYESAMARIRAAGLQRQRAVTDRLKREAAERKVEERAYQAAIEEAHRKLANATPSAPPWVRETIFRICMKHGLSPAEVLGKRRFRYLIPCRHEIMWCLLNNPREPSLPKIGRWLGGLDHTTVLHGARKHQAKLSKKEAA